MKIIALVEYINKYGKISVKGFGTEDGLKKFIDRLEVRCVEYLLTRL